MDFSEELKLTVRQNAMFQCCRCHAISVEIHHIVPKHKGGTNFIENAAPLCPNCHAWFGDNPKKVKEIKEMRDYWYQTVEKMYSGQPSSLMPLVERMISNLEDIKKNQSKKDEEITEIKDTLKYISNKAIDNMTLGTANLTASNVFMASGASLSKINIEDITRIVHCGECKSLVTIGRYSNACPNCGASLE